MWVGSAHPDPCYNPTMSRPGGLPGWHVVWPKRPKQVCFSFWSSDWNFLGDFPSGGASLGGVSDEIVLEISELGSQSALAQCCPHVLSHIPGPSLLASCRICRKVPFGYNPRPPFPVWKFLGKLHLQDRSLDSLWLSAQHTYKLGRHQ